MSRTVIVVAVLVAAVFLAAAVFLVAGPAAASPPYASPTPIAAGPGAQGSPSLSRWGTTFTWEDDGSGEWSVLWRPGSGIFSAPAGSSKRHPVIQEYVPTSMVVWEDDRNGTWDLFRTTLPTPDQTETPAPTALATGPGDQLDPAFSAGAVVFENNAAGNWDIWLNSIDSITEQRLTTSSADQVDPAIDGNIVVWADRRNGHWDIYCRDLVKNVTRRLTTSRAAQTAPDVGHGEVVYQDDRNGDWDIYAYALKTGKERRLTTDGRDQTAPSIGDGRSVVFVDERNGGDIYLYDLATGAIRAVTDDAARQAQPDVAGDRIAWTDERSGDPDVYLCTLDYPKLGLSASSGTPAFDATVEFGGSLHFAAEAPGTATVRLRGPGVSRTFALQDFDEWGYDLFSFRLPHVLRKVTLTASYRGDSTHLPSVTRSVTVKPFASLSRPALKHVPGKTGRVYTFPSVDVSGTLRPHHQAGKRAVQIQVWRKGRWSGAEWDLFKTVKVIVRDRNGASSYSAKSLAALNTMYEFKFRAIHADADHTRTQSAFSPVIR
jgi:TolB protein